MEEVRGVKADTLAYTWETIIQWSIGFNSSD